MKQRALPSMMFLVALTVMTHTWTLPTCEAIVSEGKWSGFRWSMLKK